MERGVVYVKKQISNIMKKTTTLLFTIGLAAAFTACSSRNDENPTGSWTAAAPQSVTEKVADATTAVKTVSIEFAAPTSDAPGEVTLTSDYDVTAVSATDSTQTATYKAVATVKGTWTREGDSHDDYVLAFDLNTLSVTGVDAPILGPVTDEFLSSLANFTTIEDVEVSKDGTHLTFEAGHPDVKYQFVRK